MKVKPVGNDFDVLPNISSQFVLLYQSFGALIAMGFHQSENPVFLNGRTVSHGRRHVV
jgi:hypothetical protein